MNLNSFDMNLLRVLDALLVHGSTVRAAQAIGLSQPAVSAALSRLRHALHDPLFVRQGRALVPTDYARSLRDPLQQLLSETEALLSPPGQFDPAGINRDFRLSGIDIYAQVLWPGLLDCLAQSAPRARVQLINLASDDELEPLVQEQVDLSLFPSRPFPEWIMSEVIWRPGFTTLARRDHPQLASAGVAEGDLIPLDLYCDLGHALCSTEGNFSAMGDAALARVGRSRRVVTTLPSFHSTCSIVAASDLIALIPTEFAQRIAPQLGLALYRQPVSLESPGIAMVWHRRADRSPAHVWLRDQIRRIMRGLD